MSPDSQTPRPGTPTSTGFVGRYQVLERIGEGGMGALFLARDPAIERLVAIKVLRRGYDDPALRERFLREGRAAGRLRHPNIVTIFDVGEHGGDPFIAMEFLAGETLADLIRQGARLAMSRRVALLEELCDGLAYAHRAGLVHRDIKPANLMVDADGSLKILDFGIVRQAESGMTEEGSLVGTINYMSPEQVAGEPVDHRSDIFAVGLVGYEFLSSRQAFPGTLSDGLLSRIMNVTMEPLAKVCPTVDPGVSAILNQALQRKPEDRYQDLARMRNELATARQRIEAEEERAASAAAANAGETAVISTPIGRSSPGTAAPTPSPPGRPTPSALKDAERALATGNYRAALTLAGRSAAEGGGREASGIVQRAHTALLEQGRRLAQTTPAPAAPAPTPTPTTTMASPAGNWIAIGVAVVALVAAGAAIWFRPGPTAGPPGGSAPAPAPSGPAPSPIPGTPPITIASPPPAPPAGERPGATTPPGSDKRPSDSRLPTPDSRVPNPKPPVARPTDPAANPPEPAPSPIRAGAGGVEAPRRTGYVEPVYPPAALNAGVQGTVDLELTIDAAGRVTDARVLRSIPQLDRAAQQAAMQWRYEPTLVGGAAVPVIVAVPVTFTPPPAETPRPREPSPPPPADPVKPPVTPDTRVPPAPDPRAEENAIRQQLHNYEAAWKSLSVDALRRVQQLSAADATTVQKTMADAQSYEVTVKVESMSVDGTRATVRAQVSRGFRPRSGPARNSALAQTIDLEKQGDRWMIVRFR